MQIIPPWHTDHQPGEVFWLVDGKMVFDVNLIEYGTPPAQCQQCGEWFCLAGVTICGRCHSRMMYWALVFEQLFGLPRHYRGISLKPDLSGWAICLPQDSLLPAVA